MIGIFVFQLLMIGVFALKGNALISSLCIPLPLITFVFYKFIRNNFDRSTIYLSLSLAKEIKMPEREFLKVQYIQLLHVQLLAVVFL
jgi:hypothetical protein